MQEIHQQKKNTKYRVHPSSKLVTAYRDRPFQGQNPKEASVIFFGIDANYAFDIEDDVDFFKILLDYHNDGVAYWKNNSRGEHHPFLTSMYRSRKNCDGFFYHDTFRKIDLPKNPCANAISFVELLNVPTTGKLSDDKEGEFERLLFNGLGHLKEIHDSIFESRNKLVFMPNEVIKHLKFVNRKTGMFNELNYKYVKAAETPIIYRNNDANITVYKIFHFSSVFHRSKVLAQGKIINQLIMDEYRLKRD